MKIDFKELMQEFNNLRLDYDLKKKNWFNIGGKTKAFYKACDLKELIKFLKKIQDKELIKKEIQLLKKKKEQAQPTKINSFKLLAL